ncbi:hypothetical protein [Alsobacter sp. SYSU BS001988]|jgi:hypothetical protein
MTVLTAEALHRDPEGIARLRAVLATAPGYADRCEAAASRNFMAGAAASIRRGGAFLGRRSLPTPALCQR